MVLNQQGVAFSVCNFFSHRRLVPIVGPEAVQASSSSLSTLWVSFILMRSFLAFMLPVNVVLVKYYPITPTITFCSMKSFLSCNTASVYSRPFCQNVSGGGVVLWAVITALPEKLLRDVPLILGNNCFVRKGFLCASRTPRLCSEIQKNGECEIFGKSY